jgi:hypothetical protein
MPCKPAAARVSHLGPTLHLEPLELLASRCLTEQRLHQVARVRRRDAAQLPRGAAAGHRVSRSTIEYPRKDAAPTPRSEPIAMITPLEAVLGAPVGVDGFLR